jgi:protein-disulfide isomerase
MFVFRHLPLEKIHASALEAARFAECAGRHGKFWEVHDEFFRHQQQLASELGPIIRRVNLNPDALNECVKGEAAEKVQRDVDRARALGIKGTPAFLVGRIVQGGAVKVSKILSGARPLEDFENALKPLLSGG